MSEAAERVYQRVLLARVVQAMSRMDAKRTLGFPADANPSEDEIRKVQRKLVVEFGHEHGGDPEKIRDVNIAAEILKGNYNADNEPRIRRRTEDTPRPPPPPKREPPKTVDTIKGQSFEQAVAGLPHAIWKAISKPEWAEHPRDENNSQRGYSSYVWALFGEETNGGVVVVGLKQRGQNLIYDPDKDGNVVIEPDWQATHVIIPKGKDVVKYGPSAVKKVTSEFADNAKPRRYPQKYVAFPGSGGMLEEQMVLSVKSGSGGASLKDILVSTGLISGEHSALQGRKTNVEVIPHYSSDKLKRLRAERGKGPVYAYEAFDFEVRVNGKSATLSDEAAKNLEKNVFIIGVFSYDPHDNVPKNLTKLRPRPRGMTLGPKDAITLLYQGLTSAEPAWLHEALKKASEEYNEPEVKTARDAVRLALYGAV